MQRLLNIVRFSFVYILDEHWRNLLDAACFGGILLSNSNILLSISMFFDFVLPLICLINRLLCFWKVQLNIILDYIQRSITDQLFC